MPIYEGIIFGLLLAIMIGPVFFALLQTAMTKGFMAGVAMAFGILLSDAFYAFICYAGISQLTKNPTFNLFLGLVGGVILLGFGFGMVIKPIPSKGPVENNVETKTILTQIGKGIMLNGINPFVLIFWIGIATMVNAKFSTNKEAFLFFLSMLGTVFSADILKVFVSGKLRSMITARFMMIFNRISGITIFVYGGRMLVYAIIDVINKV